MLIITNSLNKQLSKIEKHSICTNKPFARHELLFNTLSKLYTTHVIQEDLEVMETAIQISVNESYLHFLKKAYNSWLDCGHDLDYMCDKTGGLITYHINHKLPQQLDSLPDWKKVVCYAKDCVTPIMEHTYETAIKSAYLGHIVRNHLDKYNTIYCLTTFPGHHYEVNKYGGYCFVNNVACCVHDLKMKRVYQRFAILDLDYHHGDGTESIFYNDTDVLTASIHISPQYDYPIASGFNCDEEANFNIGLEPKSGIIDYIKALNKTLDKIDDFKPDILLISLGFDTLKGDPACSNLGGFNLVPKDFEVIGKTVKSRWTNKIIVFQEGGYKLDSIAEAAICFFKSMNQ